MRSLPWFQFYANDWKSDLGLQACSMAAKGLWIELLCVVLFSPRRGYLQHENGEAYSLEEIARVDCRGMATMRLATHRGHAERKLLMGK